MRDIETEWMAAMRRGDFATAWAVNDHVLATRDPATRDDPRLPYHLRWVWDGRPFRNRHVLVRCYHGLGDTLQFARTLPALRPHVASLTVEAQPELLGLLATVPGPDRLIPFILDDPAPPSECDIEIMELPHALRLHPGAIRPPYLQARPAPLPSGAVGLCWQAGGWNPARSIPPALLAPLLADRPVIVLQPGPADPVLQAINPEGSPAEIDGTAALIAGLDLVITVDTMVAHLAGALNRPTWLLLKHDADWRWMEGPACAWYPSMRLYRQTAPGDWHSVAVQLAADLRQAD
jgi:glycosyl transferase family 9 (putative heptosyltransferase)